jgi:hypothetical protein
VAKSAAKFNDRTSAIDEAQDTIGAGVLVFRSDRNKHAFNGGSERISDLCPG